MLTLSTLVTTTGQLHPACPCPALGSSPARAHSLWSGHSPRGHFLFCYWEKSHQLKSSSFSLARKYMVCVFSVPTPPPRDGYLVSGWRPLSDPSRWGDGLLSLLSVTPPACLGAHPLHCPQHPPDPPGSGCLVPSQSAHLERAWLLASSRRAPLSQESGRDRKERSVEFDMLGKRVLR